MNNYLGLLSPQNIFFVIIISLFFYKAWLYLMNKTFDNSYNETILKATKSNEGYSDDTVISSVFKEWWT